MDYTEGYGVFGNDTDGEDNQIQPKENIDIAIRSVNKINRAQRNSLERKRKDRIKLHIAQLKEMIPEDYQPCSKRPTSTNAVLEVAVSFMDHLVKQSKLFFQDNGDEAQRAEISRLKQELRLVSEERDMYAKMVHQAESITHNMIPTVSKERGKNVVTQTSPSLPTATAAPSILSMCAGDTMSSDKLPTKLPGQGLIITQTGHTYYVNEKGVAVAEGMTPAHLLPEKMLLKTPSTNTSTTVSTTVSTTIDPTAVLLPTTPPDVTISAAVSQSGVLSSTNTASIATCDVVGTTIPNGLVALPGHSNQVPRAIILPNGQVIPVVSSSSSPSSDSNTQPVYVAATSTATSTAAVTTLSSSTSITSHLPNTNLVSTSSTGTAGVLLATTGVHSTSTASLQPAMVQPTITLPSGADNSMFCKIMPKPTIYSNNGQNLLSSAITLTPIPGPMCSVSIAPSAFPQPPAELVKKKKRGSRKSKKKESDVPTLSKDILAAATANLFPTDTLRLSQGVTLPTQEAGVAMVATTQEAGVAMVATPSGIVIPTHPLNNAVPTIPLTGIRAQRTRKRKIKEREAKAVAQSAQPNSKTPKRQALPEPTITLPVPTNTLPVPTTSPMVQNIERIPSHGVTTLPESSQDSQAIEFDSNDLDNILDQVESIDEAHTEHNDMADRHSGSKSADYQLVTGDEEIGPVFTSPSSNKSPTPRTSEPTTTQSQSVESTTYTPSDSYLIGNLTKTVEQPVDHRLQPHKSLATSGLGTVSRNCYTGSFIPYQPYTTTEKLAVSRVGEEHPSADSGAKESRLVAHRVQSMSSHSEVKVSSKTVANVEQSNKPNSSWKGDIALPVTDVPRLIPVSYSQSRNDRNVSMPHQSYPNNPRTVESHITPSTTAALPSRYDPAVPSPQTRHLSNSSTSHITNPATPSWSPAKEAENVAKTSQSHMQLQNQTSVSQNYYSTSSHYSTSRHSQPTSSHNGVSLKKLNDSVPSNRVSAYQYPHFTSTPNSIISTPITKHDSNKDDQHHHFQHHSNSLYTPNQQPWFYSTGNNNSVAYDQKRVPFQPEQQEILPSAVDSDHQRVETHLAKNETPKAKVLKKSWDSRSESKGNRPQNVSNSTSSSSLECSLPNSEGSTFNLNANLSSSGNRETMSKQSSFSAESLLNMASSEKPSVKNIADTMYPRYHPPVSLVGHSTDRIALEKDRNFLSSHTNSSAFNVNLFSSRPSALNTLPAPISSSLAFDPSFTFSLTNTSAPLPLQPTATYQPPSSSLQHPYFFPLVTQSSSHDPMSSTLSDSSLASDEKSKDGGMSLPMHQSSYTNPLDPNKKNPQKKTDSSTIPSATIDGPKSRHTKSRQPQAVRDVPALPYDFPSQPYGMSAFPPVRGNETTHQAPPSNLFNPQSMYNNKPSGSLGTIPFQHTSAFPALHQRAAHAFSTHPEQIQQSTGLNLNNIFKEHSSMDAFKRQGNGSQGQLHPAQASHLYHNPMSINSLLSTTSGFDSNRVSAFAGAHNFPGFHPAFDFNLSNQP